MKRLVVCCDGTWNTPKETSQDIPTPTNVFRIHNCVAPSDSDVSQLRYYHPGVGTDGSFIKRIEGGIVGAGLDENIMSAFRWLADNYSIGDEIFLFGFSRGAFTVRSLAGFIHHCGLPDLTTGSQPNGWDIVKEAYDTIYRSPQRPRPEPSWAVPPIKFIGVWDTVGSLGIPNDLAIMNLLDRSKDWSFHDTTLGTEIEFARHAVAIDELRASFTPTLWTEEDGETILHDDKPKFRVKQLWFPGVHSDVGGGYVEHGLSNGALKWMIDEAASIGLKFDPQAVKQIQANAQAPLHNSLTGVFEVLRTRPRNRPPLTGGSTVYDSSAIERSEHPPITQAPYHQPTLILQPGESSPPITIFARPHWNETGIYLEEGVTYSFKAIGEWLDAGLKCDPNGVSDKHPHLSNLAHLAGTLGGKLEQLYGRLFHNKEANFFGTRRNESFRWFSLVGVIANDGPQSHRNPDPDGSPYPHQSFLIGTGPTELTINPTEAGYLYAYANDAWHFYENNRGSVTMTVSRVK